jgi:hypothetical protein
MTFEYPKSRKGELPPTDDIKETMISSILPVPKDTRIVKTWINVNELSGNEELPMLKSFEPGYFVLENRIDVEIA